MTDGTDRHGGSNIPDPRAYDPTIPTGTPAEPRPPVPGGGFGGPGQPVQPWTSESGPGQPGAAPGGQADWQTQVSPGQPEPWVSPIPQPDWSSLADDNERSQRRRKWRITGIVTLAACVLGAGVGLVITQGIGDDGKSPKEKTTQAASNSPKPAESKKAVDPKSPFVDGQKDLIADRTGQNDLAVSPDATVSKGQDGYLLRMRSNMNSYAQSATEAVDVTKSFTVSAWVFNEAQFVSRAAISQGDGKSFSFELGRDDVRGRQDWVFRVQTGKSGADSTTRKVVSKNVNTHNEWVLLMGSYDAKAGTITLYVNGVKAGSAKTGKIFAGSGPLQIGRSRHHDQWVNPWSGVMGSILVWDEPFTAVQAARLKAGSAGTGQPTASWLVG
ncbi:hypothetical protein SRB5_28970 [Streptomyces sp. RB5]|uniref:LamG-like jellyroll fold domain-containing protein n=1 Tax=Streptomyces smaragdinus TaxID=2585196 RepID=A0A7K0CH33_9ACTN|nr:LamG domain-containing protein [Streptomyces smaragdinus]MQY12758.1 hypothetical protein [Streptomyces smaragdinus]